MAPTVTLHAELLVPPGYACAPSRPAHVSGHGVPRDPECDGSDSRLFQSCRSANSRRSDSVKRLLMEMRPPKRGKRVKKPAGAARRSPAPPTPGSAPPATHQAPRPAPHTDGTQPPPRSPRCAPPPPAAPARRCRQRWMMAAAAAAVVVTCGWRWRMTCRQPSVPRPPPSSRPRVPAACGHRVPSAPWWYGHAAGCQATRYCRLLQLVVQCCQRLPLAGMLYQCNKWVPNRKFSTCRVEHRLFTTSVGMPLSVVCNPAVRRVICSHCRTPWLCVSSTAGWCCSGCHLPRARPAVQQLSANLSGGERHTVTRELDAAPQW